jgi:hypothetical protein
MRHLERQYMLGNMILQAHLTVIRRSGEVSPGRKKVFHGETKFSWEKHEKYSLDKLSRPADIFNSPTPWSDDSTSYSERPTRILRSQQNGMKKAWRELRIRLVAPGKKCRQMPGRGPRAPGGEKAGYREACACEALTPA